jgi:hypothetical protein
MGLPNGSSWSYTNISLGVGLWTSCYLAMGDAVRLKENNIAKGFKFQGLQ